MNAQTTLSINFLKSAKWMIIKEGVEEGKGNGVFKKIVGYFTKNLGQADSINDIETDYMWMKPDINVAISYSTGQIKMRYYYNFSMGEK